MNPRNSHEIFEEIFFFCKESKSSFNIKIIEEGFRFEDELPSDSFPNGVSYIYRNIDNELIGRTEFVPEENAWNSRYYMFGGGTTFGGFTTKWMAAQWALLENAKLPKGWNE